MSTQNLELTAVPDSSGSVFPQSLEAAMTLATAALGTTEGITINAPTGADVGLYGRFTVPDGYIGTPRIVVDCVVAEAANTLAVGVQFRSVAPSESVDQAYETEDLATQTVWTGFAAEDRTEVVVTLTPSSAFVPGDTVYFFAYRDDSADTQTGAVHDVKLHFRWEGGAQALEDHGYKFEYLTAATVRMALDTDAAVEDTAKVWTTDGTDWQQVALSSTVLPLTLDLSTTGAGGIISADTPEAVQGYDIYLITDSDGGNAALLAVDPGTDMSLETLPGSSTHWSRLVWFLANNLAGAANLVPFYQAGRGRCSYDAELAVLTDGTATTRTLVDLTNYVPSAFTQAHFLWRSVNVAATHVQVDYFSQSTGAKRLTNPENLRNIAGADFTSRGSLDVPNADGPADSLYYLHSASPSLGTTLRILRWELGS